MQQFLAGLDVGQEVDHTALCIVQGDEKNPPTYDLIFIYRWPLHLPNVVMIADIKKIIAAVPGNVLLNVDYTGKGEVFGEFLERSFQTAPRLTNVMTECAMFTRTMKENLVTNVKLLLGDGRFRIRVRNPARFKESSFQGVHEETVNDLFDELCNYRVRISQTAVKGKPTSEMGALGYGEHDDLATCLFLALMGAETVPTSTSMFWIRR